MKKSLKIIFVVMVFLQLSINSFANVDELPSTRLKFSVFRDTIVTGFDTEFELKCGYDIKKISITATGCSIMLKDAEKGIYVVKAPVTSIGKTSEITVSVRNDNGTFRELETFNIPIVGMSTEMKKRYVHHLTHKK